MAPIDAIGAVLSVGPMRSDAVGRSMAVGAGMDAVGRTGIDAPMHRRSMRSGGPMHA